MVFNYILAIRNEDYTKAYGYLAEKTAKPTISGFRQGLLMNKEQVKVAVVDLGKTSIDCEHRHRGSLDHEIPQRRHFCQQL